MEHSIRHRIDHESARLAVADRGPSPGCMTAADNTAVCRSESVPWAKLGRRTDFAGTEDILACRVAMGEVGVDAVAAAPRMLDTLVGIARRTWSCQGSIERHKVSMVPSDTSCLAIEHRVGTADAFPAAGRTASRELDKLVGSRSSRPCS